MLEVSGITNFGIFTFSDVRPYLAPHPPPDRPRPPTRSSKTPHPMREFLGSILIDNVKTPNLLTQQLKVPNTQGFMGVRSWLGVSKTPNLPETTMYKAFAGH